MWRNCNPVHCARNVKWYNQYEKWNGGSFKNETQDYHITQHSISRYVAKIIESSDLNIYLYTLIQSNIVQNN